MKICRLCFSIKVNNELICPLVSVRWKEQDSGPGLQFQVIKMLYCHWVSLLSVITDFGVIWSVTRWSCDGLRDCLREKTEIEFCSLLVCGASQVGEWVCPRIDNGDTPQKMDILFFKMYLQVDKGHLHLARLQSTHSTARCSTKTHLKTNHNIY